MSVDKNVAAWFCDQAREGMTNLSSQTQSPVLVTVWPDRDLVDARWKLWVKPYRSVLELTFLEGSHSISVVEDPAKPDEVCLEGKAPLRVGVPNLERHMLILWGHSPPDATAFPPARVLGPFSLSGEEKWISLPHLYVKLEGQSTSGSLIIGMRKPA